MKTKILSSILILMFFAALSKAQDGSQSFTLKQTLIYALDNSIAIQKARLDQEQADHKVNEFRGQALPQISGNGQLQYFPNIPVQLLPGEIIGQPGIQVPVQFGTDYILQGGFEANQKLYDQSIISGLKAVKSSEELYRLLKISTDEDVIFQVSNRFYEVLEIQAQINALDGNIIDLGKLEELMKLQYENDLVTKIDYNRVRVNRTNLETRLQSLKTAESQQKNLLKVLIGMPIATEISLSQDNIEEIGMTALQNDQVTPIQLQLIQKEQELNMLNEKNIRAGYFPTLSAFFTQSWQAQRNEFDFFDGSQPWFQNTVIGARISVPIFDGRQKHHRVQQNKIDIQKLELDAINTRRNIDVTYENARQQLFNTAKSVAAQKENQGLAQEVYDQTQELYKEQVSPLTDLLDSENALRDAQVNYRNEILKFKKAELNLLQAQGQLRRLLQ